MNNESTTPANSILLIEDEPSVTAFVRAALERHGYTVVPASSGAEGLERLVDGSFGGVIHSLPVYAVLLGIHDLPAPPFKVTADAEESWVLLGRDVLNAHRLLLDGPHLGLEIG